MELHARCLWPMASLFALAPSPLQKSQDLQPNVSMQYTAIKECTKKQKNVLTAETAVKG